MGAAPAYSNPLRYTDPTGHESEPANPEWSYTAPRDPECGKTKTCTPDPNTPTQPGATAPQSNLARYYTQESVSGRATDVASPSPVRQNPGPGDQATKDRVGVGAGDLAPTNNHSLRSKDGLFIAFLKSAVRRDFSPGSPFANEVAFGDHPILQSDKALTQIQNGIIAGTVGAVAAIATGGIAAGMGVGLVGQSTVGFVAGGMFTRGTGVGLAGGSATDQLKAMVDPTAMVQDALLGATVGAATVVAATIVMPAAIRAFGSLRSAISGAMSEAGAAERAAVQTVTQEAAGAGAAEGAEAGLSRGAYLREKFSYLTAEQRSAYFEQLAEGNAKWRLAKLARETPGAHFIERHGAEVSTGQLVTRANTGWTPDLVKKAAVDSSRFTSYRAQYAAIERAMRRATGAPNEPFNIEFEYPIGELVPKHGSVARPVNTARVILRNGKPYTAWTE